jgi:hypothetical protein
MAFSFKNIDFEVTNSIQPVYTAPANKQTIAIGLRVSSRSQINETVTVIRYSSGDATEYNISGEDTVIPVGSALNVADGNRLVFMEGDELRVVGSNVDALTLSFDFLELDVASA